MTQAHMIEGTTEEVTRQMQQSYAGQNLRVFIKPEESEAEEAENLAAGLPAHRSLSEAGNTWSNCWKRE